MFRDSVCRPIPLEFPFGSFSVPQLLRSQKYSRRHNSGSTCKSLWYVDLCVSTLCVSFCFANMIFSFVYSVNWVRLCMWFTLYVHFVVFFNASAAITELLTRCLFLPNCGPLLRPRMGIHVLGGGACTIFFKKFLKTSSPKSRIFFFVARRNPQDCQNISHNRLFLCVFLSYFYCRFCSKS